jgi:hypothetical protein
MPLALAPSYVKLGWMQLGCTALPVDGLLTPYLVVGQFVLRFVCGYKHGQHVT